MPDIMDNDPADNRTVGKSTSPIALFIVNKSDDLQVVAIQSDYRPGIPFYRLLEFESIFIHIIAYDHRFSHYFYALSNQVYFNWYTHSLKI